MSGCFLEAVATNTGRVGGLFGDAVFCGCPESAPISSGSKRRNEGYMARIRHEKARLWSRSREAGAGRRNWPAMDVGVARSVRPGKMCSCGASARWTTVRTDSD